MQEEIKNELLKSLEVVKEYLGKTAEFASEQAPLVIDELVRFNLVYSGVLCLSALVIFLVWAATSGYLCVIDSRRDTKKTADDVVSVAMGGGMVIGIPSIIVFFWNIKDFIMCLTAPRLFVIEYLADLIK